MHYFCWLPGTSVADIENDFQVRLQYDWAGTWYDLYGSQWATPSTLTDYSGGVIGHIGMAFGGAYGVNTPEAETLDTRVCSIALPLAGG